MSAGIVSKFLVAFCLSTELIVFCLSVRFNRSERFRELLFGLKSLTQVFFK